MLSPEVTRSGRRSTVQFVFLSELLEGLVPVRYAIGYL